MPVLVVLLTFLALTVGFCWGRGTAGADVEAGRAELAVEAHELAHERAFLACWARSLVVQETQATTYTCHAAKEIYDQAEEGQR